MCLLTALPCCLAHLTGATGSLLTGCAAAVVATPPNRPGALPGVAAVDGIAAAAAATAVTLLAVLAKLATLTKEPLLERRVRVPAVGAWSPVGRQQGVR